MAQPAQMNIDVSTLDDAVCECGGKIFTLAFTIKLVPALISPNGKASYAQIPAFVCINCNTPLPEKIG